MSPSKLKDQEAIEEAERLGAHLEQQAVDGPLKWQWRHGCIVSDGHYKTSGEAAKAFLESKTGAAAYRIYPKSPLGQMG